MNFSAFLDSILAESGGFSRLRTLLFDGVTGLPTLPLVIESLKDTARTQQKLGIIFVDTAQLDSLEKEFGWEIVDRLLNQIRTFLDSDIPRFYPLQLFSVLRTSGDSFLLILYSSESAAPLNESHVSQVAAQLEDRLNKYISMKLEPNMVPYAGIFNGYAVLEHNANIRFERLLARSINQAFRSAIIQQERAGEVQIGQLQEVVNSNQIRTFFQPIFFLSNLEKVLGHEALSRGPEGSVFEAADYMFAMAARCGMLNRLENLCQLNLIASLETRKNSGILFVNLEPSFLEKEQYQKLVLFNNPAVDPQKIVLEITERIAISDYQNVSVALETIRQQGFRIAVDDVGSGYASLESIAYLNPDFIKINEKMVSGIHRDFIKQEIVKTLRDLASRFNAMLIAEGIEEERDLETLLRLGVQYGQGFLLKRPSQEFTV